MLESSRAAQCPSVAYQLAGAKKVQQDLAMTGVVERFVDGPEEAALIRACFAGAPYSSFNFEVPYICFAPHVHRIAACGVLGSFMRF